MAILDNLVSYYKLDESSGDAIDSFASNDGTVTGAIQNVSGKINTAYSFDGIDDNVNFGDLPATSYSISAWIYLDSLGANQTIFAKALNNTVPTIAYIFSVTTANKVQIQHFPSTNKVTGTTVLTTGTWYHVVATYDSGTTTGEIYVNGSSENDGTMSGQKVSSYDNFIGIQNNNDNAEPFEGRIDEVGFWDRAISSAEVTSLYNGGTGISYPFVAFAQSSSIDLNNGTITSAKLTATYTGNVPTLSMTANGSSFEMVTSGTAHTFSSSGTDLRWKAEGSGTIITKIVVEDYK